MSAPQIPAIGSRERLNRDGVASLAHLCLVLLLLFSFPALTAITRIAEEPPTGSHSAWIFRFLAFLITYLWVLFAVVRWGLRTKGTASADIIGWTEAAGKRWPATIASAVLTFAVMLVTAITANAVIARFGAVGGVGGLTAETPAEATLFLAAALSAGFVEEFVFRGYLQRQFTMLTGSLWFGSVLQVLVFTVGHLYQGGLRLIPVFLLGCVMTLTALWRKSLVPGMLAHGLGDALGPLTFLVRLIR